MAGGSDGRPDRHKDELIARIRDGRARLDRKLVTLEQRVAVVIETKDRVLRYGRLTAVVLGVVTVTLAAGLLLRAIMQPRRRRR